MNILIVLANPKENSFSLAMANKYKEIYLDNNKVEILDLYKEENQQGFLKYSNANEIEQTSQMTYYQEKISNADEIVFIFPYWWGGMPAIMKNFIDWNFSKGFAFTYVNSRPKGLLQGKTVKVFTTTGAPSFIYTITGANRRLKNTIKEQIVEFCGMKLTSFKSYGSVDTNKKNTKKILEQIK